MKTGATGPDPEPPIAEPATGADNYQVGRELARGGMGSVMEARDGKLGRTVAVKIMLQDADADPVMRQRFLREAEVLALLAHPNIVPIYDIVWEDGLPLFYAMKLVKGRTLQAILGDLRRADPDTRREFTLDRLLLIFRKVCDAMAFTHSKRVLHRDLKPENIMVGEFGEVMVMDWGLAKKMDEPCGTDPIPTPVPDGFAFGVTLQGAVVGTPHYMSPEQAMGLNDDIDERSDIYALGGILYAILTLHPPVDGTTMEEVLGKVKSSLITAPGLLTKSRSSPRPVGTHQPEQARELPPWIVPAALSAVVMKALQHDKAARYDQVASLAAEIEAWQNGFATRAQQAGLGRLLQLLILRHQAVASLLAIFLFVSLGFVVKLIASERFAVAQERIAIDEKQAARLAFARAQIAVAEGALREGNGLAMRSALHVVPPDLRSPDWEYLLRESDTSIQQWPDLVSAAADPTRAGVFAVSNRNGKVIILKLRTGERLLEFTPEFPTTAPPGKMPMAYSADGQWLALSRENGGGLAIYGARSGRLERSWPTPPTHYLEFDPVGRLLRFGLEQTGTPKSMEVWAAATGERLWQDQSLHGVGVQGTFRPGHDQVLQYNRDKGLQLVDAGTGALLRHLTDAKEEYFLKMVVHPDGQTVFASNGQGLVTCLDLESGQKRFELAPKLPQFAPGLGLTPGGDYLITGYHVAAGRQVLQLWNARTGAFVASVLGGHGVLTSLLIHPLSGEMIVPGAMARAWNLDSPPVLLKLGSAPGSCLAFLGTDDLLFCNTTRPGGRHWGVNRLQADGVLRLWTPLTYIECKADTTPGGGLAAVMLPPLFENGQIIQILRKMTNTEGGILEKISEFKPFIFGRHLRLSPSGRLLALSNGVDGPAISTGSRLDIHDTASGRVLSRAEASADMIVQDCGWVPGDRLIGLVREGRENAIILWDAATGKIIRRVPGDSVLKSLAMAPDSLQFAETGEDGRVRIRDSASLAILQEFRAHNGPATAVAWHPKNPTLATASSDLTVRLWDLATQQMIRQWRTPERPKGLRFSPTGKLLAGECYEFGSLDRVWQLEASPPVASSPGPLPLQDIIAPLFPVPGEIPKTGWKIHRVSSIEEIHPAAQAIDGDPATLWHSRWTQGLAPPPHEIVIDLGTTHRVSGLVYVGMSELTPSVAKDLEFSVSDDPDAFPTPTPALIERVPSPQILPCPPQQGRYVLVRIKSTHAGNPVGSAAEIGVIGD